MISTQNLSYSYSNASPLRFPDINLENKDNLLVLGNSGRGKTTFLHLLAGLLLPSKGEIIVDNTNIVKLSNRKLDRFRGTHIGLIFQKPYFVKALTVKENLLITQKLAGEKADEEKIESILNQLNILNKALKLPAELSVGEQQRASIARAIINKPSVILADEPTSALDDENAAIVSGLLKKHAETNDANLIVVTHDNRLKSGFQNILQL